MRTHKGSTSWESVSGAGRNPTFNTAMDLWDRCVEYFNWIEKTPFTIRKLFHYKGTIVKGTENRPRAMTISGLCTYLDINFQSWQNYKNLKAAITEEAKQSTREPSTRTQKEMDREFRAEEFLDIITRVENIIYTQKFQGAAAELFNPQIIAREIGLRDHTTHEHTGEGGGPISVTLQPVASLTEKK